MATGERGMAESNLGWLREIYCRKGCMKNATTTLTNTGCIDPTIYKEDEIFVKESLYFVRSTNKPATGQVQSKLKTVHIKEREG